jgi:hypothetical protein
MIPNTVVPLNTILARIRENLLEVENIGRVDVEPGGPSPWSQNGNLSAEEQFFWYLDVIAIKQGIETIPGSRRKFNCRRDVVISLEGWLPYSQLKNTASIWRNRTIQVINRLEKDYHLNTDTLLVGVPLLSVDDYQVKSSLNPNDAGVLCHYCRIALPLEEFYDVIVE